MPSDIFLSAYSVITIAPSISIPIPRSRPIITRKLTSPPAAYNARYVRRKQKGIESPTNIDTLGPKLAIMRIIIKTTAVIILPFSSFTISLE